VKVGRTLTTNAVKCHQRNLELNVSRYGWCDVDQLTLDERWLWVESGTLDRRTRQHLPHFLNWNFTEVAELQTFMANIRWRRRQHALLQLPLDEELSKFVDVDDTGLCHVTRLMKMMTTRARGYMIFESSTIVTILHRFQDRSLTKRLKIAETSCRSSIWRLTLWRPVLPYGYSYKVSCATARPG